MSAHSTRLRSRDVAHARRALLDRARAVADGAAAQRQRHGGWTAPLVVAGGWDAWRAVTSADLEVVEHAVQSDLASAAVLRAGVSPKAPIDLAANQGRRHAVRGAAGELETLHRIGGGQLAVPAGVERVELLPFTAPGADLLLSGSGTSTLANVKMTVTADPLLEHWRRHPEVPLVYASSEAAADAARWGVPVVASGRPLTAGPAVVDTGISVVDLDSRLTTSALGASELHPRPSVLDALAEGPLDGLWDIGELVAGVTAPLTGLLPIGTLLVVGVRAGLRDGMATPRRASASRAQLARAAVSSIAARGVTTLSHEPTLGLVAALTTSIALGGLPAARQSWTAATDLERRVRAWTSHR